MDMQIKAKPITVENFKEYGQFIDALSLDAAYSDNYFDWWDELSLMDLEGKASIGMVRPHFNPEFDERLFEQHNNTPELLCPLDKDIIVLVGKPDAIDSGDIDEEKFEAFIVPQGTVVLLDPGVWHHAPMVFSGSGNVLVIFREGTSETDKEIQDLESQGIKIRVVL